MVTLVKYAVGLALAALSVISCSNDKSLQKYLVEKQDDNKFMKVDLATSLLKTDNNSFTEEENEILESVKKVNVVAYQVKDGNKAEYDLERQDLNKILEDEKYQLLSKIKTKNTQITFKYVGEETAIDEIIIFADDSEKGFAIFRLLGDDMRPEDMMKLYRAVDKGSLDLSKLSGIGDFLELQQ